MLRGVEGGGLVEGWGEGDMMSILAGGRVQTRWAIRLRNPCVPHRNPLSDLPNLLLAKKWSLPSHLDVLFSASPVDLPGICSSSEIFIIDKVNRDRPNFQSLIADRRPPLQNALARFSMSSPTRLATIILLKILFPAPLVQRTLPTALIRMSY